MTLYLSNMLKNEQKPCDMKGCCKNRRGFSKYCAIHSNYRQHYGHPSHTRIIRKHYREHIERAEAFIENNQDSHKGIIDVLAFIAGLLEHIPSIRNKKLRKYLYRLADEGVTPRDILIELTGFYYYTCVNKDVIKSDEHLLYQLANRFLRLAPVKGFIPGSVLKYLGKIIANNFLVLLIRIARAFELGDQQQSSMRANMLEPFNTNYEYKGIKYY